MKQFLLIMLVFLFSRNASAQINIAGTWAGKLVIGPNSLQLVFHINKDSSGYSAKMDSPDQGAFGIGVTGVDLKQDSLFLIVSSIGGKARGRLINDSVFSGEWLQGMSIPLELKKVSTVKTAGRPQTPTPPYPYLSEDIIYYNKTKSIQYGATITLPKGSGPFPAIILITGSGQQNRDEELFGHKPFAVLADYLTKKGFAVLRVDDRGIGKTTGEVVNATSKDFAGDVQEGLEYLKTRKEIDKSKLGLLGHSEGGMIAQMVAARRNDISFLISLAGPGQKVVQLMSGQNRALLTAAGISKTFVDDYIKLYEVLLPAIVGAPSDTIAKTVALSLVNKWIEKTPAASVAATTGITDLETKQKFIAAFVKDLRMPWFRYFIAYDPDPFIKKIKSKVLVLNGEKDIQVISTPNITGWKTSLSRGKSPKYDLVELKGLNHLFQRCETCTIEEYGKLEETIAPEALEVIGTWLIKNVK